MRANCIYFILLLLALLSCSQGIDIKETEVSKVNISADSFIPGFFDSPQTKATLDGYNVLWAETDTLGIFPNSGAQVYFNTTTPGSSTTTFDGGGWGFKLSANYYSYYPFIGDIYLDRNHSPVSFISQNQSGINDTDLSGRCLMYTSCTSAESGSLNFQYHHLGCIIRVRATLPAGTYTRPAITSTEDSFILDGWYDLMAVSPSITSTRMGNQLSVGLNNVSFETATQITVYIMSAPVDLSGLDVTVSVINSQRTEYQQVKNPPGAYVAGTINGMACNAMQAVPQSTNLIIEDWGDGGSIGGTAE